MYMYKIIKDINEFELVYEFIPEVRVYAPWKWDDNVCIVYRVFMYMYI